ncbi:MAG: efflux RND transporter permease subunit, partial [Parvularcula sp.]|nr:efflux RND transporter permease subunit [Parvularcula sp.]
IVSGAIGGANIGRTVEGLARYPINVRYPREIRDSLEELRALPLLTPSGQQITLGTVAQVSVSDGPPMLKNEQGRLISVVYVDTRGRDLTSVVNDLQAAVSEGVDLPAGVSISYAGQFEYLTRANERLRVVIPATLGIIFILLYLIFRRFDEALLVMGTLPFALTGGFWLLYLMGYNQSVATSVGFIALAGVSAEFGVIMLIYLKSALARRSGALDADGVGEAIREGALLRVRPKAMTVAVILAGLFPILIGTGALSEVMSRIAAPMVGGMITAPLLSMFVIPAAYLLMRRPRPERPTQSEGEEECVPQT